MWGLLGGSCCVVVPLALLGGLVAALAWSRRDEARTQNLLRRKGRVVKGWIVFANDSLYRENPHNTSFAQVVFTLDDRVEAPDEFLAEAAKAVRDFEPDDPPRNDERIIGQVVSTHVPYETPLRIPQRLTGAVKAYTASVTVFADLLPEYRLTLPYVFCRVLVTREAKLARMIPYPDGDYDREDAEEYTDGYGRLRRGLGTRDGGALGAMPAWLWGLLAAVVLAGLLLMAVGLRQVSTRNAAKGGQADPAPAPGAGRPVQPGRVLPDPLVPPAALPPDPLAPTVVPVGREPYILGTIEDPAFKTVGPPGAVLVGVEARFEKFGDIDIVRAVRPVYRVGGREERGKQFGDDLVGAVTLKARAGYAVGGITGKAEWWCHGFSLRYMRVKPDGTLDPADAYDSEWAGWNGPMKATRVVGTGAPAVGLVGKIVGPKTTALGLMFRGQEGRDPAGKDRPGPSQ